MMIWEAAVYGNKDILWHQSMSLTPGTMLCAPHIIFHLLPPNPRGTHFYPYLQMGKSRFRDVKKLA